MMPLPPADEIGLELDGVELPVQRGHEVVAVAFLTGVGGVLFEA